jgi:RluA family pseudouridine synthase
MALLPGDDGPYVFESAVPPDSGSLSLLEHLVRRFTYRSEEAWRELVQSGDVSLDGVPELDPARPLEGTSVLSCLNRGFSEPEVPTDWRVAVQGEDWLAVAKPSGMPIHSTPRVYRQTLVWQVRRLWGPDWTPAHRLDRDTSGLVLFARGRILPRWLGRAFAAHRVTKEYLALVEGALERDHLVEAPIGSAEDPRIGVRRAVRPDGQEAATLLRPIGPDPFGRGTWVLARPRQGRTHQIRVHCESAGHPIVGDVLYDGRGGEGYLSRAGRARTGVPDPVGIRLHLHAWRLVFSEVPPGTLPREILVPAPDGWPLPDRPQRPPQSPMSLATP